MKFRSIFAVLFLTIGFPLFAEGQIFNLSVASESIIVGSGAAVYGTYFICDKILKIDSALPDGKIFNKADVNPFDSLFMNPYNKKLDFAGTFVGASVMASAGILALAPASDWMTIGTMYGETLLWAYSLKCIGKLAIGRTRPYMYFENIPEEAYSENDWNDSFPSAHSTFVFAAAGFTSYVFSKYFPESLWRYAVMGGTYSIAAVTAVLRIASGKHFITDVLAGAAIGSVCGFLIPFIHTLPVANSLNVSLGPLGNAVLNFVPWGFNGIGIIFTSNI